MGRGVIRGVLVGVGDGILVAVGAGAVLNAPPIPRVKLVGCGVGVAKPKVGVGEGMGVAASSARTVPWTRTLTVASMSGSEIVLPPAVWVSATTACTVA
jgi:hypothetical protein